MSNGGDDSILLLLERAKPVFVGEYTVSVSLSGNADAVACAAPVSGGAHASTSWHAKGFQGLFRHAYNGDRVYVPLFALKLFRRRFASGSWGYQSSSMFPLSQDNPRCICSVYNFTDL